MKSRHLDNDYVDAYVTTFLPNTDADKGHTRLDLYESNSNQKVMMQGPNGRPIHASLSVYPSSRPYQYFPTPIQIITDYFKLNPKTNVVGDLTGVPVEGFSVKDYESDIKYQRKSPASIHKVQVTRNIVKDIEAKHENLKNNKDQFVLNYKTALVPFMMKCIYGTKMADKNFNTKLGYSFDSINLIPEDLAINGGGYLCDIPDKSIFPNQYNCSAAVYDVLHADNVLPADTSPVSIYPDTLQQVLVNSGATEVTEKLDQVPKEIRRAVKIAKQNYPNPNTLFGRAVQNLGCEPDVEGDLIASVFKSTNDGKQSKNRT
jgi:hypothetical protein